MTRVLIIGDSHTGIFGAMPDVVLHTGDPALFTTEDYIKLVDQPDSRLSNFFKSQQSTAKHLIICLGEIDARAHYWKHLATASSQGIDPACYIRQKIENLYQSIKKTADLYDFERVVLWGAPPAVDCVHYNPGYPFIGSVPTRNAMVHLFAREFINRIKQDSTENRIRFSTGFYEYINPLTYLVETDVPIKDGIHYILEVKQQLWNLLTPVVFGDQLIYTGASFDQMQLHTFKVTASTVAQTSLYDTWVREKDIVDSEKYTRKINIKEEDYCLMKNVDTLDAGNQYTELCLQLNI
jgi:hypothetical protein